jgi:hypothetical protein
MTYAFAASRRLGCGWGNDLLSERSSQESSHSNSPG